MQNPPFFYREESPSDDVSHFVLSFWEFSVDPEIGASLAHEVFPDGCVSLAFYHNEKTPFQKLFIVGINQKSIYVDVNPGDQLWGMRILPEACCAFLGMNPLGIRQMPFDAETLKNRFSPALFNELCSCRDFRQAVEAYRKYAEEFGVGREEIDSRLAKATRIFIETEGTAKISETAREVGLSERQFERNYRKASGLTPKQFARICRFRATGIDLVKNSAQTWANRAAEKGFTDQSHLNREFSRLTGNSPVEFSENVKRIKHGKILE